MSNQQKQQQQQQLPASSSSNYRRNSVPYQPNLIRPTGSSPSNHGNVFFFPLVRILQVYLARGKYITYILSVQLNEVNRA